MIGFLRGILAEKGDGYIVIDVNGVGYLVSVPANSAAYLNAEGEEVLVHTSMIVREDEMSLYGFSGKGELDAFKKLIGVSGVGPKAALAILVALGAYFSQIRGPYARDRAVIADGGAEMRALPTDSGKTEGGLPAGHEVRILEERADCCLVRCGSLQGWVPRRDVLRILPGGR